MFNALYISLETLIYCFIYPRDQLRIRDNWSDYNYNSNIVTSLEKPITTLFEHLEFARKSQEGESVVLFAIYDQLNDKIIIYHRDDRDEDVYPVATIQIIINKDFSETLRLINKGLTEMEIFWIKHITNPRFPDKNYLFELIG